jgi:hypothetical protein
MKQICTDFISFTGTDCLALHVNGKPLLSILNNVGNFFIFAKMASKIFFKMLYVSAEKWTKLLP